MNFRYTRSVYLANMIIIIIIIIQTKWKMRYWPMRSLIEL